MARAEVFSRAALAGNPSDGFGGAVCSVIVPMFSAVATVTAAHEGTIPLVEATIRRFASDVQAVDVGVSFTTTIPRSVGLAGSSAIVIASLQALNSFTGAGLASMDIAGLAHTVERVDLGIAGGWQDQLVQSHGVSALVECAEPRRVEPVEVATEPPIPLYLAWSNAAAEASGQVHRSLRAERSPTDPQMMELAALARSAAASLSVRDVHSLKQAINATFDIRRTIMDIAPAQSRMIDTARNLGASANFAGSGGAIIGVLPKNGTHFMEQLSEAGYDVVHWDAE